ncbi:uncharacterized protein LOC143446541 [Clavelina lepadiformis]|uniref:uncharacterized protein LOC143446541 n=1 Tax=Clavelina lepadiformis TaxID=159417 RepID=UPI0040434C90
MVKKAMVPIMRKASQSGSLLHHLRKRELYGFVSKHITSKRGSSHHRMYSSIPTRLVYSLKDIVDQQQLMEEAHVFLGFNSDGTFVISYTESVEAIDNTGVLSFVYRLHWWLFQHHKKMIKLRTVRLFANEEISASLRLSYAEWPKVKSKVIVYGYRKGSDNCYITVSAVPARETCEHCTRTSDESCPCITDCLKHSFVAHMKHTSVSTLSAMLNTSGLQIDDLIILNMGHSIGVISLGMLSEHESSETLPLSSVKWAAFEDKPIEDQVAATTTSTTDKNGNVLYSPQHPTSSIPSSELYEGGYEKGILGTFAKDLVLEIKSENSQELFPSQPETEDPSSTPYHYQESFLSGTTSDSQQDIPQFGFVNEAKVDYCTCAKNGVRRKDDAKMKKPETSVLDKAEDSKVDPYFDFETEPKSIALLSRSDENIRNQRKCLSHEVTSNAKSFNPQQTYDFNFCETSENCCCGIISSRNCSEHSAFCNWDQSEKPKDQRDNLGHRNVLHAKSSIEFMQVPISNKVFNLSSKQYQNFDTVSKKAKSYNDICTYCGFKIREQSSLLTNNNIKKKENQSGISTYTCRSPHMSSPSRNLSKLLILSTMRNAKERSESYLDLNAPTPSPSSASESGSSMYCVGDTGSQYSHKSENLRRTDGIVSFFETLYGNSAGFSGLDDQVPSAANNLFYGPVTFEGVDGTPLHPMRQELSRHTLAYSQHLVLDIEHVIFDVLRTRCYTTYKFGYLIDYDVQIIDTCPATRSVVILIAALLNISPRKAKGRVQECFKNNNLDTSNDKSQQFKFFLCWRLQTGRYEVIAASPLQVYNEKNRGRWDAGWAVQTRNSIRKACEIPLSCHSSVFVLNNAPVIQGKSLTYLFDVDRMVALRK